MRGRGKPFTKGNPGGGRPKKSVSWKQAEEELRDAMPRILLLPKNELSQLLMDNPTGVEMLAAKYLHEHVSEAVNRFLGKTPHVLTGKDGEPLIPKGALPVLPALDFSSWKPEQVNAFIKATAEASKKAA